MATENEVRDALCHHILTRSPYGIIYFDDQGKIVHYSDALLELLEISSENLIGSSISKVLLTDLEALISSTMSGDETKLNIEYHIELSTPKWLQVSAVPVQLQEAVVGGLLFIKDLTQNRELQDKIKELIDYDYLTDLPNRKLFTEQFRAELGLAQKEQEKVALYLIDLDRFKAINDISGFEIGDQVLKKVSQRLAVLSEANLRIARFGGDTFALLNTELDSFEYIERIASQILDLFREPICIENQQLQLTVSVGISVFPDDGDNESQLMKRADIALSHAKKSGRNNYKFYSESVAKHSMARLSIERNLRKALINNQFQLYYQPQIKCSTGDVIGYEALIRWNYNGKIIPPIEFIPIAEETGLIHSIGEWVLREACQQNKRWQKEGLPRVPIAVNLSVSQIQQPNFVNLVSRILEETELEAKYLELELTESMFIQNMDTMVAILKRLKDLGVSLVLDDFGTGYSSFSYLRHLFIDTLKIDRSFVQNIPKQPNDGLISTAIINLAKSLEIHVIAEGVETEEQVKFLLNNNCENMQGYLFSQPLPPEELKEFLIHRKRFKLNLE